VDAVVQELIPETTVPQTAEDGRNLQAVSTFVDGMVGLGPQKPPGLIADMLINELYNNQVIGAKAFTLYLDIDSSKNKFWFGSFGKESSLWDFVRTEIGGGFSGMNDLQIPQ
jgi:hypothetical protein